MCPVYKHHCHHSFATLTTLPQLKLLSDPVRPPPPCQLHVCIHQQLSQDFLGVVDEVIVVSGMDTLQAAHIDANATARFAHPGMVTSNIVRLGNWYISAHTHPVPSLSPCG